MKLAKNRVNLTNLRISALTTVSSVRSSPKTERYSDWVIPAESSAPAQVSSTVTTRFPLQIDMNIFFYLPPLFSFEMESTQALKCNQNNWILGPLIYIPPT